MKCTHKKAGFILVGHSTFSREVISCYLLSDNERVFQWSRYNSCDYYCQTQSASNTNYQKDNNPPMRSFVNLVGTTARLRSTDSTRLPKLRELTINFPICF